MIKIKVLFVLLVTTFSTVAFATEEFITVCGYIPEGNFTIPYEITLTDSTEFPSCPSSVIASVEGRDPEHLVLLYELPGGY